MAIDSAAKRYAMIGFASSLISLFNVDGSVGDDDRYVALTLYNGIPLSEPEAVVGGGLARRTAIIARAVQRRVL